MLLVHPVQELIRFLPFVVGAFVLGGTGDRSGWQLLSIALPVALGVLRFLTTSFRITPTQVELRRGLLSRKVLTAPLDRVRAVELTSPLIHRVLGLAKVEIGTASAGTAEEGKFALDALPLAEARAMRTSLLHRISPEGPADGEPGPGGREDDSEIVLVRLDPAWVRFAPLTSSGNVIAAGLLGVSAQFAEQAGVDVLQPDRFDSVVGSLSVAAIVVSVVLGFLVLGAVFAVLGYLVSNWAHTVSVDAQGRAFHIRRGLLTSKETSLERTRVRGVEVSEPFGLRLAGAARLSAIVTGLSRSERSSTQLVPPAPRRVVDAVGGEVVGDPTPLRMALRRHGPAARRRRHVRAVLGFLVPPALVTAGCLLTPLTWWAMLPALLPLPLAPLLAADRYRRLGHALTPEYVVVASGSLRGRRDVVQRTGIIGWNVQQSWFQRRAGLATLVATTAAGQQAYAAIDIPEHEAIALAHAAVPGLMTPFLS